MRIVWRGSVVLAVAVIFGTTVASPGAAEVEALAVPQCHGTTVFSQPELYELEMPTTAPDSGVWECGLPLGAGPAGGQGRAVLVLQRALIQCYDQEIVADSEYGPRTQEAVRHVQRYHNQWDGAGLVVDGIYGPKTARWMYFVDTDAPIERCL